MYREIIDKNSEILGIQQETLDCAPCGINAGD